MTAIIILAAGQSTRLGRPKQTLRYRDESLLKHSIKAAVDSNIGPVIVVVGSNEKEIHSHIENEPVSIVLNNDFQEGIASSIRAGIS
ncbi:MAG: nucleotidyltransferase family protein, partial [Segetibacter sp.]